MRDDLRENLKRLPKVELHRHLEGSVRPETFHELMKGQSDAPTGLDDARRRIVVSTANASAPGYQEKLRCLTACFRSREIIERVTAEAIRDAAADGVRYLELRVEPHELAHHSGQSLDQVFDALLWGRDKATTDGDSDTAIGVGFIVKIGRFQETADHQAVAEACIEAGPDVFCGIAIDGDVLNFPIGEYASIMNAARQAEMGVTIRAGRSRGASNIVEAMSFFSADRIGHGLRVLQNDEAAETARAMEMTFEVCLTANVLTRDVDQYEKHPFLDIREAGIPAVLCTNDPTACGTTLTDEYVHAVEKLGLSLPGLQQSILDAAAGAFIPEDEAFLLQQLLLAGFAEILPPDELLEID